jgi:hypothetical protein
VLTTGAIEKFAEVGVVAAVEKFLDTAQGHAAGLQGADGGELEEVAFAVGPLAGLRSVEKPERAVVAQAALGEVFGSLSAGGREAPFGAPVVHGFGEFLQAGERRRLRAEFEA